MRPDLQDPEQAGPMDHLVTACQQLAAHFHCSPYEFFDKPAKEVWAIYDFALKDVKRQVRDA